MGETICRECDKLCKTCTDLGSDKCIFCADGIYMNNSKVCVACESGKVYDPSKNSCVNCNPACVECKGLIANSCTKCLLS